MKLLCAKSRIDTSVLNIPMATPPPSTNSCTVKSMGSLPSSGVNLISSLPFPGTTKSVALYFIKGEGGKKREIN